MGRSHPQYCKHDHMVDGGDFYELDDITPCPKCAEEAADEVLGVPALNARVAELESKLDEIMKVIRHCAGESSFDSCNYRHDSKPYCTECCRHDYEGHDPMCWRRLAFEGPQK